MSHRTDGTRVAPRRPDRTSVTPTALLPLLSSAALAGLATLTGSTWLVLLAASALGPLAAAVVLRPRVDGLAVTVHAPALSAAGADVTFDVVVRNDGAGVCDAALIEVDGGHATVGLSVPPLRPGATVRASLTASPTARGAYETGWRLGAYGPFGLLERTRTGRTGAETLVHATPVDPGSPASANGAAGGDRATIARDGTQIAGLREWRPGDGGRRVHARASARHGRPVVLDREEPVGGDLTVLLATTGPGPESERAVALATGALLAGRREGRTTTVVWHDGTGWEVTALRSSEEALRWSARVPTTDCRSAGPPPPVHGDLWVAAGHAAAADGLRATPSARVRLLHAVRLDAR